MRQGEKLRGTALTFDDVLVIPRYSEVLPGDVETTTRLTARITLNIPILAAAMDTVCESALAIALAREGGLGFIHKNLPPQGQAAEVLKVKRSQAGMITNPVTVTPETTVAELADLRRDGVSGFPILADGRLVGIVTNRDLRFVEGGSVLVRELMTTEELVTAPVGTSLEEAKGILHEHRIEKLPIVDDAGGLVGLITAKDLQLALDYPAACRDDRGRLRVGAAIGPGGDCVERAELLADAGVDVFAVDSAHGHSEGVRRLVTMLKREHPQIAVVGGNVATADGAAMLADAGADAIKVGMGPGSICTTRVVSGCGMPQVTALLDCVEAVARWRTPVPVVADGGIQYSGDLTKALAVGADAVMIGSLFAGTEESPGDTVLYEGRTYKLYRGMGSEAAMKAGSAGRYGQAGATKFVSEGVEGRVPHKGHLRDLVFQLVGGLRQGMGYAGARTIAELQRAALVQVTNAARRENHPHGVALVRHERNYTGRDAP